MNSKEDSEVAAARGSLTREQELEQALRRIVIADTSVTEGSSGHPVIWWGRSASIANEVLRLSREDALALARECDK